jgi:hypothetical protein
MVSDVEILDPDERSLRGVAILRPFWRGFLNRSAR